MKKSIITILTVCLTASLIGEFTQKTILAKTPLFTVHFFNSVPALYVGLRDFSPSRLRDIHAVENQRMEDTVRRTHVTDDERINGMFGSLRNRLLRERTVMVPYYQGKEVFFGTMPDGMGGDPGITLFESDLFLKPWISYSITNHRNPRFRTMYFDRNFIR